MKKIIFLMLVLTTYCVGLAAQLSDCLTIITASGEETKIVVSDNPKIKFDDETILVSIGDEIVSMPLSNIVRYYFESGESNVTDITNTPERKIVYKEGGIYVYGFEKESSIDVFSVTGLLLLHDSVSDDKTYISFDKIQDKLLIVKVGDITFKILRK